MPEGAIKGVLPMSGVYTIPALPPETRGMMAMFPEAFGSDPEVCKEASPTRHVARLAAPMLVITETQDPGFVRASAVQLRRAADQAGVKDIRFMDAEDRNHFSIVTSLSRKADDPQRSAMVDFIRQRCKELDGVK